MSTIINGTEASETLNGVNGREDNIIGYGGHDTLNGLSGNDVLRGGAGRDTLDGGADRDMADYSDSDVGVFVSLETNQGFNGTAQGDRLISIEGLMGSRHDDWFVGNHEINSLYGREGNDVLKGGGGNDFLYGGAGGDTLDGGDGVDTVNYYDSPVGIGISLFHDDAGGGYAEGDNLDNIENVYGSAYDDSLWGDDRPNNLQGTTGDDTLKGYGGNDSLVGGADNDTIYGMNDNDTLYGHAGTDWLEGGLGIDTLYGNSGADTFMYRSVAEAPLGAAGFTDDVRDFSSAEGDKIDLSAIDAGSADGRFIPIGVDVAFNGVAGELRYNAGFLEGDVTGDGNADFQIRVNVVLNAATDLYL